MRGRAWWCVATLLLTVVVTLPPSASGQLHWEKLFDSLSYKLSSKPAPRRESAIAHDRDRNRLVVFGGWQANSPEGQPYSMPVLFDDTWEFNLHTKTWRALTISLIRPQARYGMLYSHNKYGLYICGGRGYLEEYFNDLWIYDFSEDIWYKMDQTFISIVPEPRYGTVGGMYPSYEFGDVKNNLIMSHGRSQYNMYGNMFVYTFSDLRGLIGVWVQTYTDFLAGPYGFNYPHGRAFASSAMISPTELLIHGGCMSGAFSGGPCPAADSWIYASDKNTWLPIDASCISPRRYAAMASLVSDGYRQSAVLFSGLETDTTILQTDKERDDEVALYDSMARKWIKKRVQGFYFPEKRNGHVMCSGRYRADFGAFLFGGFGHASQYTLADIWFLSVNISSAFDNPLLSNFYTNGRLEPCSSFFSTIHLHAILMFVGWAVFMNSGTLVSRYCKFKSERLTRLATKLYRTLQLVAIFFISVGLLFGLLSTHGLPHLAHLLIGLAAYVIAVVQPISSFLRMRSRTFEYYLDEEEKVRAERFKSSTLYTTLVLLHDNLNRTAMLLAIVNMSMGVFYAVFEWYWVLMWFIFLGVNAAIYFVLEARVFFKVTSKENAAAADNVGGNTLDEDYDEANSIYNLSKCGSTQQLQPNRTISIDDLRSNASVRGAGSRAGSTYGGSMTREQIQMQPMPTRYAATAVKKTTVSNKLSPATPPPPYTRTNNANRTSPMQLRSSSHLSAISSPTLSTKIPPAPALPSDNFFTPSPYSGRQAALQSHVNPAFISNNTNSVRSTTQFSIASNQRNGGTNVSYSSNAVPVTVSARVNQSDVLLPYNAPDYQQQDISSYTLHNRQRTQPQQQQPQAMQNLSNQNSFRY